MSATECLRRHHDVLRCVRSSRGQDFRALW